MFKIWCVRGSSGLMIVELLDPTSYSPNNKLAVKQTKSLHRPNARLSCLCFPFHKSTTPNFVSLMWAGHGVCPSEVFWSINRKRLTFALHPHS